ncbi:protein transport protein Sec24-like [Gossypium australe]|uniref:Protein transport protein Sec24-like n=1 Tax=Gossypium australe TaxID=47621 RepID=A0A5B6VUH6_9ROSI|nr:protein transport protein Sec24-like [Gossypium australe]
MAADLTKYQIGVNVYAFSDKYTDIASLGAKIHILLSTLGLKVTLKYRGAFDDTSSLFFEFQCRNPGKVPGGQVYYYPNFQSSIHGENLRHELARDLTRETAWEAVMRIRCGKGIQCTSYHGNFMLRSTDLLALPTVDCDKAYAVQLSLEETLLTTQTVYFQAVLLYPLSGYTASCGERLIRVHTAAASVVSDLGEMYR